MGTAGGRGPTSNGKGEADPAFQLAAQALVMELFARIDTGDLDGAAALYADDAVFLGATGRAEIRAVMERGLAAHAGELSRHVITNVRSRPAGTDAILVRYRAVAYGQRDPAPFLVRSILDQEQVVRRRPDGALEVAEQRISGFPPPSPGT